MQNRNNQKQIFADLVSLEAWHDEFTEENSRTQLFANVVFGEATMGTKATDKVTFRLKINRAEVIVIINDTEPACIDPREVARFVNASRIKRTVTQELERSGTVVASAEVGINGIKGASLKASGSALGNITASEKETLEQNEEISLFEITQSRDSQQNYRWIIEQIANNPLMGAAWDPNESPLVTIMDRRKGNKTTLPPSIRVAVQCLRENLVISDLKIKNPEKVKGLKRLVKKDNINPINLRAAETVIRNSLTEYGLEAGKLDENFSRILLGSILAESLPTKPK